MTSNGSSKSWSSREPTARRTVSWLRYPKTMALKTGDSSRTVSHHARMDEGYTNGGCHDPRIRGPGLPDFRCGRRGALTTSVPPPDAAPWVERCPDHRTVSSRLSLWMRSTPVFSSDRSKSPPDTRTPGPRRSMTDAEPTSIAMPTPKSHLRRQQTAFHTTPSGTTGGQRQAAAGRGSRQSGPRDAYRVVFPVSSSATFRTRLRATLHWYRSRKSDCAASASARRVRLCFNSMAHEHANGAASSARINSLRSSMSRPSAPTVVETTGIRLANASRILTLVPLP